MYLLMDFEVDNMGRVIDNGCRNNFRQCDDANTENDVEFFADNENQFQNEFRVVYQRMLRSAGSATEQELTSVCEMFDCNVEIETLVVEDPVDVVEDPVDVIEEEPENNDSSEEVVQEEPEINDSSDEVV